MPPVLLDATHVIFLGQWHIAPFVVLLFASIAMSGRESDAKNP
jgi:hypothetical protein